jgi:hypothetical protein
MITLADMLKLCVELDQQMLTSRPSAWGVMAEKIKWLAEAAEMQLRTGLRDPFWLNWENVDLSPVRDKRARRGLDQTTLTLIEEIDAANERVAAMAAMAGEALKVVRAERGLEDSSYVLAGVQSRLQEIVTLAAPAGEGRPS